MFGPNRNNPAPLQLYHLGVDGASCETVAPQENLAASVHYYWRLEITAPGIDLDIVPDTAIDLVLAPAIPDFSVLYFPNPSRWSLQLEGPSTWFGICMAVAEAPTLFGLSTDVLKGLEAGAQTTEALALEQMLLGLEAGTSLDDFAKACNKHFTRAHSPAKIATAERHQIRSLLDAMEEGQVPQVAAHWNVSERQLRRLTGGLVGMSPKQLQNVLRLQATLVELLDGKGSDRNDFHDDSHRIREVRRLTGLTPGDIRRMAEKYNKPSN